MTSIKESPDCHRGLVEAVFSFERFLAVEDLAAAASIRLVFLQQLIQPLHHIRIL